jgi:hypothetical protein
MITLAFDILSGTLAHRNKVASPYLDWLSSQLKTLDEKEFSIQSVMASYVLIIERFTLGHKRSPIKMITRKKLKTLTSDDYLKFYYGIHNTLALYLLALKGEMSSLIKSSYKKVFTTELEPTQTYTTTAQREKLIFEGINNSIKHIEFLNKGVDAILFKHLMHTIIQSSLNEIMAKITRD